MGVTPHELVFGRDRNLAGIPRQPIHDCREAEEFMDRMRVMDTKIAHALNEAHKRIQDGRNKKRKEKPPYATDAWVWLLKPRQVGGRKVERWWRGHYQIAKRTGENSYQVVNERGTLYDVHWD